MRNEQDVNLLLVSRSVYCVSRHELRRICFSHQEEHGCSKVPNVIPIDPELPISVRCAHPLIRSTFAKSNNGYTLERSASRGARYTKRENIPEDRWGMCHIVE